MNHWLIFQPCLIAPEGILGIKYPIKSPMIPWWPLFTNLPLFSRYIPWKSWNTSNNNSLRVYSMVFHDFHVYSWYILVYNTIFQWSPTRFAVRCKICKRQWQPWKKAAIKRGGAAAVTCLRLRIPPQKKRKTSSDLPNYIMIYHDYIL